MKINDEGLELIKLFEECRLEAYQDIVGVWTIGYGHTGADVYAGLKITQARADELLAQDLEKFERAVTKGTLPPVAISDNQFSAMVAFCFNVGAGAFLGSTLLKKFNAGDSKGAAEEFLRWSKAGGKQIPGLVRRRQAERKLFLT